MSVCEIAHVTERLRRCNGIDRVVLVADAANREAAPGADVFIDVGQLGEERAAVKAVETVEHSGRCLVMTGDMGAVLSEAVSDFLTYAPDADIIYPIVEKKDVDAVFPTRSPYYVNTKEGKFTGSSQALFRPSAVVKRTEVLVQMLNARQNPTSLVGILGAGLALRIALGRPSLKEFQSALSSSLKLDCRVFISHFPEMFLTLDSQADVDAMHGFLAGSAGT